MHPFQIVSQVFNQENAILSCSAKTIKILSFQRMQVQKVDYPINQSNQIEM